MYKILLNNLNVLFNKIEEQGYLVYKDNIIETKNGIYSILIKTPNTYSIHILNYDDYFMICEFKFNVENFQLIKSEIMADDFDSTEKILTEGRKEILIDLYKRIDGIT